MEPVRILPLLQLLEDGVVEFKNLIEIGALFEGRKSVVRLVLTPKGVQNVHQFFGCYYPDVSIRLSSFVLEDVFQMTMLASNRTYVDRFQRRRPARKGTDGERVVFVGMQSAVDEAWTIEEDECLDTLTARLYGYPACCGAAYRRITKGEGWLDSFFGTSAHFASFDLLNNRLSSIVQPWLAYHFDYFPCSAACGETWQINRQNREMLARSDLSEFVELADTHLAAAAILHDGCVWYVRLNRLQAGRWSSQPGLEPVIRREGAERTRLAGLRISREAASALIGEKWRYTGGGEVRVYLFRSGEGCGRDEHLSGT